MLYLMQTEKIGKVGPWPFNQTRLVNSESNNIGPEPNSFTQQVKLKWIEISKLPVLDRIIGLME
jgi:hypothetical protein